VNTFYNEFDPFAAQWLRNLAEAGEIPDGRIDERSIASLSAADVRDFRQVHLFAGIGGWPLALRIAGWPKDQEVWTGSAPCQPFSAAGKGKGHADDRNLWPEMLRLVRECRPATIFGEQVEAAIRVGWLDGIFSDLEAEGYACGAHVLGAHSVQAPHIRQRIYWVAVRVADAGGTERGRREESEREQRELLHPANRSGDDRMADPASERFRETRATEPDRRATEVPSGISPISRVADAECADGGIAIGPRSGNEQATGRAYAEPGRCGDSCRMGNSSLTTSERNAREILGTKEGIGSTRIINGNRIDRLTDARYAVPWREFAIIPCRDGKFRRIPADAESEILGMADGVPSPMGQPCAEKYPLATKTPGRSGRLKGYGNAICIPLAAEFIRVAMEII
jgi:DNA (cytosine-5)-methyltransferase 1